MFFLHRAFPQSSWQYLYVFPEIKIIPVKEYSFYSNFFFLAFQSLQYLVNLKQTALIKFLKDLVCQQVFFWPRYFYVVFVVGRFH